MPAIQQGLQMLPQVLTQVKPISDLGRMRQCSLDRIRISTGPVSAHYFNFLVTLEPGENGISGAIRQQIEWPVGLE